MFKGRHHKIEFNDGSVQPPLSKNSKAYASNIKRHSSMRQHHSSNFYLENEAENSKRSYSNQKFMQSKKYVSCENVRQQDEDFQEVSGDEEEDENGIKDKLMKRYNSLTTLLMKSFRKAKNKKKKGELHISQLETNIEENTSCESVYPLAKTSHTPKTSTLKSDYESNRNMLKNFNKVGGVVRSGSLASSSISRSLGSGSTSRADSDILNEAALLSKKSNASIDNSMPIFKG